MDKKEMLEELISHYTDGNKAKFANMLGVAPQTINTWIKRQSFDIELVYSKCEGLSGDWLLSGGEGDMLRSERVSTSEHDEIIQLRAENSVLREVVGLKKNRGGMVNVG